MYNAIMIPVDLAHVDQLTKALKTGADLAKVYSARLVAVGVTGSAPSEVAHNPVEYAQKLAAFAADQSARLGVAVEAKAVTSHDPAVDIDDTLEKAADEIGADLVVMASHIPGMMEYVIASRAGYLASHSSRSVFVVR
jgi:nucleotide-binding universal stress UspA family protein